jgi:hypothetical protein
VLDQRSCPGMIAAWFGVFGACTCQHTCISAPWCVYAWTPKPHERAVTLSDRIRKIVAEMEGADFAWCMLGWTSELDDIADEIDNSPRRP